MQFPALIGCYTCTTICALVKEQQLSSAARGMAVFCVWVATNLTSVTLIIIQTLDGKLPVLKASPAPTSFHRMHNQHMETSPPFSHAGWWRADRGAAPKLMP